MMGNQRPSKTSTAYDRIRGVFSSGNSSFATHPLDRIRAAEYLIAALKAQVTWADAEGDIRAYLATNDVAPNLVEKEIDRARDLLEPWLS